MDIKQQIQKIEQEVKDGAVRVFLLASHSVKGVGHEIAYRVGEYYHVEKALAEELIAKGAARLASVHDALLEKAAEDRALAAADAKVQGVQTSAGPAGGSADVADAKEGEGFVSPAPGVAEAGEGGK